MTVITTSLRHQIDGVDFDAVLVSEESLIGSAPTVLVFHGMEGRSDAQLEFATELTGWGYQAVAVDLFGDQVTRGGPDHTAAATNTFLADRGALAERLSTVVSALTAAAQVDPSRVAAIGFCFGGLCVLDLARGGHDLRGVASFHGLLTPPGRRPHHDVRARIIVFHGWDDPFAPPEDVVALGREFSGRGIDWQLHAYGNALHAFMAPWADDPERGIRYDERAARRAWESLGHFLLDCFAPGA